MSKINVNTWEPEGASTAATLMASGDTVTLPSGATLDVNGEIDLTGATVTGLSTGKILQVVSATYSTETDTTGTTYIDSGLTLAITPSATTSKVFVMMFVKAAGEDTSSYVTGRVGLQVVRDSTIILGPWTTGITDTGGTGTVMKSKTWNTITYLDSPSATSSTVYKLQFQTPDTQAWVQSDGETSVITLMEVGA